MLLSKATPPQTSPVQTTSTLATRLRAWVEELSYPRHFTAQPQANRRAAETVAEGLHDLGYRVALEGPYRNVVAWPHGHRGRIPLVGAHYDSVPNTPGADDNASGLAVLLEVARLAAEGDRPVALLGFNCEEDGLVGSRQFVASHAGSLADQIALAHVLEMVGYSSTEPGSQRSPLRLPGAPDVGDFIGVVADHGSVPLANRVLQAAKRCVGGPKVVALKTYFGMHRHLPDLSRSDHSPFWEAGVPALMWTDTAEFRNPNYHATTDTPDTLDYRFMASVVRLLLATLSPKGEPA